MSQIVSEALMVLGTGYQQEVALDKLYADVAEAFLKGQPRKATIATTLFRDKYSSLSPDPAEGALISESQSLPYS